MTGVEPSTLVENYPVLFHMAEEGSWDCIKRNGLLSTEALLDLFKVDTALRSQILTQRRATSIEIAHPDFGTAVVRDQLPLSEKALGGCLTDMTFKEWLGVLNSRVFFWLDEPHLETLLGAKAYRENAHDVIQVETAALLDRYQSKITMSPINSGSTIYKAQPRGSKTFLPIEEYPYEERRKKRGIPNAIVELAVDGGIPSITEVAIRAERRRPGGVVEKVLWERK